MKKKFWTQMTVFLFVLFLSAAVSAADTSSEKLNFNQGWKFVRQNIKEAIDTDYPKEELERWESVDLPHTVRTEPYNNSGGINYQGEAMYRKHFKLPASYEGKKLYIEFEGVMGVTDVWVNGQHLQGKMAAKTGDNTQYGGYLPFILDITDAVHCDDTYNVITVLTDNRDNETVPPGKPQSQLDFTYFGGIYRNVWLQVKNPVHITDAVYEDIVAGGGILVEYPKVSKTSAEVSVKTHIRNESSEAKMVTLETKLLDEKGIEAAKQISGSQIGAEGETTESQSLTVANPNLWNLESPYLYKLVSTVKLGDEVVDVCETKIGIRKITMSVEEGLKINGEETGYLSGVNRHQEYPYVGYAASSNMQRRDAIKFKEGGFNIVRTAHTPQSIDFIEACDELGILVLECVPGWQHWSGDEKFAKRVQNDIRQMIRRTRNHPSILCYEVSLNETSGMPEQFTNACNDVAKEEHPDLFTSAENHRQGANSDILYGTPSEVAGWSDTAMALIREYADNWAEQSGNFTDAARVTRGPGSFYPGGEGAMVKQAQNNLWNGYSFEGTGAISLSQGIEHYKNTKRFIGTTKWIGIDHNRGYDKTMSPCGVWDLLRLPKYSYYAYESQRDAGKNDYLETKGVKTGPSIFIASSWSETAPVVDKTNEKIGTDVSRVIHIYSNAEKVKLSVIRETDGHILWEKTQNPIDLKTASYLPHPPYIFEGVPYESGSYLKAEGLDGAGSVVMTKEVHTAKEPAKLKLEADFCGMDLTADGSDQVMVYAYILDENGTVCQNADDKLYFTVEGEGVIVGDNDRRVGANPINAESGVSGILLQSTKTAGKVKVSVRADNMESDEITIDTAALTQNTVEYEEIAQGPSMEYDSAFLSEKEEMFEGRDPRSITKGEVQIGEETYGKSITAKNGLHISYDLGGHYSRFTAYAAVKDASKTGDGAVFKVYGDGVLKYKSLPVKEGVVEIDAVDISGCSTLTLAAEDASVINPGEMYWLSPYIEAGSENIDESELKENLALGKTASASSTDTGTSANDALDGSMTTLWRSGEEVSQGKPQSWILDLGRPMDVRNTRLAVEHDYLRCTYNIYTSTTGVFWKLAASGAKTGHGNNLEDAFTAESVRYVKVEFTKVESTQGQEAGGKLQASVKEFEIYPDKGVTTVGDYNLKGIEIAGKDLVFSPEQTEYELPLEGFETDFYVKALPANLKSSVTVNGIKLPEALESDMNSVGYTVTELTKDREIVIEVTSPDKKGTKQYTVYFQKKTAEKTYDALKGFVPGVNGANGWSYQIKQGETFSDMEDYTCVQGEYAWSGDEESDWIYSGPKYMHPGTSVNPVRTFTVPEAGIIRYQANIEKLSGQGGAAAAALMKNGTKIWPRDWDDMTLWGENEVVKIDVSMEVNAGDLLQLAVNCKHDGNGNDGTGVFTSVTYLDDGYFEISGADYLLKKAEGESSSSYGFEQKSGQLDEKEALSIGWRLKNPVEGAAIDADGVLTIDSTIEAEYVVLQAVYKDQAIAEKTVRILQEGAVVYLSDMDWESAANGWNDVNKNYSNDWNPIRLSDENGNAVTYEKGLGAHASSEIVYHIADQGYTMFYAMAGIDYEMYDSQWAGAEFKVFFDDNRDAPAYSSGEMGNKTPQKEICIPIPKDAQKITLWIDELDGNSEDHADWADAKFIKLAGETDVSALTAAMETAEEKLSGDYSESVLAALRSAFYQADRIKNNKFAVQSEVDTACSALTKAYQAVLAEETANAAAAAGADAEIGKIGEVTLESKAAIEAARTAYNKLTAVQKKLVTKLSVLVRAETVYAALEKAESSAADEKAVKDVMDKIDAIGTVVFDENVKNRIDTARSAYDKLTDAQKALVSNKKVLEDAEAAYEILGNASEEDRIAARAVREQIENIGEVTLDEAVKERIERARAAYDALTDAQKALVYNLEKLEAAEAAYEQLAAEDQKKKDQAAAQDVMDKINAIGTVTEDSKGAIEEARAAYQALTDAQKKLVTNISVLEQAETDYKQFEMEKPEEKPEEKPDEKPGEKPGGDIPEVPDKKLQKNKKYQSGKLYYTLISETELTVAVAGPVKKTEKAIQIPDTVELEGHVCTVTEISNNAFKKNKNLKKAVIGKNITVIGKNAFAKCTKLAKIKIKSSQLKKAYASSIKGISKKAVIDVPNKKIKAYKKLFKIKRNSKVKIK